MKHQHIYDLCKQHMHSYVLAETEDGNQFDGILTGLDEEYAYFAVPIGPDTAALNSEFYPYHMLENSNHAHYHTENNNNTHYAGYQPNDHYRSDDQDEVEQDDRQFPYFGYPGYGFPGYGYRPRRFFRLVLPLAALVALSTLPWY